MLYVLHGDDFAKRGKKLDELVQFFLGKKPNTTFIKVKAENFDSYNLDELAEDQGLFEQKCVVLIEGLFEDKEIKEVLIKKLQVLSKSGNIFILNERILSKGDLSVINKNSEKVQEFLLKEKMAQAPFNIFSLADAVGGREKKRAWTLYLKALENGSEPEEIHGTIFWAVKNMGLVKNASMVTAEDTGLKPFVFTKAKVFSDNYSKEELNNFSSRMVSLYHDSHRGLVDFSVGLEKLILETL